MTFSLFKILFFIYILKNLSAEIQIRTAKGLIKGRVLIDRKGNSFLAFQSIPYAKPPTGLLRFKKSVEPENWIGIKDGTQDVPSCVQVIKDSKIIGVEDCLYLNVYNHEISKMGKLLPVFIFIHGGGGMQDSSNIKKYGPHYLMTEPIVLVTINYRLGVFGNAIPNLGLLDQQLALKWIHDNIKYFGGDPNKVTLGGESAGATFSHLHLLAPQSQGLFHQLILMSGTSLNPPLYVKHNLTQGLAEQLGIQSSNLNTIISKLQDLPVEQIVNAYISKNVVSYPHINEPANAGLYVETSTCAGSFIGEYPIKILKSGNFPKVPLLIGFTNSETRWFQIWPQFSDMLDISKHIPFYFNNRSEIIKYVQHFYDITDADVIAKEVFNLEFWNDIWFKYHSFRAAKYHNTKDVFLYQFSAHTRLHYIKEYLNLTYEGAAHTDDISYLFSNEFVNDIEVGSIEDTMIECMVKMFSTFVRFGKPRLEGHKKWTRFKSKSLHFVNITNNGTSVEQLASPSYNFWDFIYETFSPEFF